MLQIYPAVTVTGVPGQYKGQTTDYILYPDTEDKDRYYVLAETPTFLAENGNPRFNMTWYYGSGQVSGGVCAFTVALPMPDRNRPDVMDTIRRAITRDPDTMDRAKKLLRLCQAAAAGDAATVTTLKKELGRADNEDPKKIPFNPNRDEAQFLPSDGLQLSPIPFKSGKVTVTAFKDRNAYNNWDPSASDQARQGTPEAVGSPGIFEVTPSLLNSNAAAVSFSLNDYGANLFWHALGGPDFDSKKEVRGYDKATGGVSVVIVQYTAEFDGMLPSASATVTLHKTAMAKLVKEQATGRGAWGQTYKYEKVVGKDYKDAINNSIKLNLPVPDTDGKIATMLQQWAAKQLEDMVKAQIPDIKLADLNESNAQQLASLHDETRTYVLNQGMALTKFPQAQLPKVGGDLVPNPDDLGKFFNTINLNDRPYFNMDVTVNPPDQARLAGMKVGRFVITQLTFDGQKLREKTGAKAEVSTIEFPAVADRAAQATQKNLEGTFDTRTQGDGEIEYSYLVSYTDGTPSYTVADIRLKSKEAYVDLSAADLGVLAATFNGNDLPWGVLSSARIESEYGDWKSTEDLTAQKQECSIVRPLGRKIDGKLKYRLTMNTTSGAPFVDEWKEVTPGPTQQIRLASPIGTGTSSIKFELGEAAVTRAQIRARYTMPAKNGGLARVFDSPALDLRSSGGNTTAEWKVPLVEGGLFHVIRARVNGNKDLKEDLASWQQLASQDLLCTVYQDKLDFF